MEQAKKRDHKIFINDTAVARVDYVKLSDFTVEECMLLQSKHKNLLIKSMLENNSDEVLKICDLSLKSETDVLGDEFGVNPGENPFAAAIINNAKSKSLMFLHNHPSTNTFSVADIDTFVCEPTIKVMSVVTNQGEVYILNKLENFDYNIVRNLLKNIYNEFSGEIDNKKFVMKFLKCCKKGGIEYAKSK